MKQRTEPKITRERERERERDKSWIEHAHVCCLPLTLSLPSDVDYSPIHLDAQNIDPAPS